MAPVLMQFIAQSMFLGYIGAYYINVGNTYANRAVGTLLALVGGTIMTRAVQHVAFDGQSAWFFSLFWLGFSSLMGAVKESSPATEVTAPVLPAQRPSGFVEPVNRSDAKPAPDSSRAPEKAPPSRQIPTDAAQR